MIKHMWVLLPLILIGSLLVACDRPSFPSSTLPTRVAMPSSSFEPLWSRSEVESYLVSGTKREEIFLYIWDESAIILTWNRTWNEPHTFKKLDLLTGEVIWEAPLRSRADAVSSNSHHVYSSRYLGASYRRPPELDCGGHLGDPKWDPGCDAIRVDAFDRASGDITWSQTYTSMASIAHMTSEDSLLKISGSGGKGTYEASLTIDAFTGDLISISYERLEKFSEPDYTGLLLRAGISPSTVVSNFATDGEIVYFLTANGKLWAIDKNAGVARGELRFGPEDQTLNPLDDFKVVAEKSIVIVYLRDSQQLFAFRFGPSQ